MNQPNEHCKCDKCGMALKTEAEKQEHAKTCTCNKKEVVSTTAGKDVDNAPIVKAPVVAAPVVKAPAVTTPVVAAPSVADPVVRHPL